MTKQINIRCLDCGYAESWPFEPSACPDCKADKSGQKYQAQTDQETVIFGDSTETSDELDEALMHIKRLTSALEHAAQAPSGPNNLPRWRDYIIDADEYVDEHEGEDE